MVGVLYKTRDKTDLVNCIDQISIQFDTLKTQESHKHKKILVRLMKSHNRKLERNKKINFPGTNVADSESISKFIRAMDSVAPTKKIRVKADF